jgi:hypothetical protein
MKRSKKSILKFKATMLAKKQAQEKRLKHEAYLGDQLLDAGGAQQAMTPVVDVEKIRDKAYRYGLVTAMECILRELR